MDSTIEVGMAMNIKNDETERLAREAAAISGASLTGVITIALREYLDRVRQDRDDRVAWALAIADDGRRRFAATGLTSSSAFDDLYDEHGLPA